MDVFEDVQCIYVYVSTFDTIWTYVGIIGVGGIYGQDVTGMLLLGVRVYTIKMFFFMNLGNKSQQAKHILSYFFSLNFFGFLDVCKSPSGER